MIRLITQQPRWLLSVILFGFGLTIGLLLLGEKGSDVPGPLGLLVSIISVVVAIKYRPRGPESKSVPDDGNQRAVAVLPWRIKTAVVSVIVLLVGISAGTFYATVIHRVSLPVTDQANIDNGQAMTDGVAAMVNIRTPPDGRNMVAMTLRLINPDKTGNCVGPTRLEVAPVINGSVGSPLPKRPASMEEFRVNIADARQAAVQVRTVNQTQGCRLNLEIVNAVLYNPFPWSED